MSRPSVTDVTDVTDSGDDLLDRVHEFLTRFVAFPSPEAADATVAWIAHTWAVDQFDTTPRLAILSPEPGSGKTRLLEVMELLVPRPMPTFNVSAAVLYRSMAVVDATGNSRRPTVLLDEADTIFGPRASRDHEDIRGLINAGYRQGAFAQRASFANGSVTIDTFPAYAPVAIAGLDDLPETIMSRSVVIRMRRRALDEFVLPYRRRLYSEEGGQLADDLQAWIGTVWDNLAQPPADLPQGIVDRVADVWEPLITMGDRAGRKWSKRVRGAATTLITNSQTADMSLGVRLLSDLKLIFGGAQRMTTASILDQLTEIEDGPWSDINGRDLDARGLAERLSRFGVSSSTVRNGKTTAKGYKADDLHESWKRYIPDLPEAVTSVTSVTPPTAGGSSKPPTQGHQGAGGWSRPECEHGIPFGDLPDNDGLGFEDDEPRCTKCAWEHARRAIDEAAG